MFLITAKHLNKVQAHHRMMSSRSFSCMCCWEAGVRETSSALIIQSKLMHVYSSTHEQTNLALVHTCFLSPHRKARVRPEA